MVKTNQAAKKLSATEWAQKYYADREFVRIGTKERARKFKEWGIGPPDNVKPGLPMEFPEIELVGQNDWKNRAIWLAAAEDAYRNGYGDALILSVKYNYIFCRELALPAWIQSAFFRAFTLWLHHDAKSVDAALGIVRPRTKVEDYQFWSDHLGQICLDINEAVKAGVTKYDADHELFKVVGKHYGGKGWKVIKERYEAAQKAWRRDK